MTVKLAESEEHKQLVRKLASFVKQNGFELSCSASLGLNECDKTEEGYIPDLKAYNSSESLWLYGEAKTEDDIDNDHTRAQIKSFSGRRVKNNNKLVPLYVAVPMGCKQLAMKVIQGMDLTQDERDSINIVEF